MRFAPAASAAVYSLSVLSQYSFAHFDFTPKVVNNQVATAGNDDETGDHVDTLRVSGYDFGEVPGDPYNISDPGFNTQGASAFAAGSTLRLTAATAGGSFLSYWNGVGTPSFTAAAAGTSLTLSGSPTRTLAFTANAATVTPSSPASLLIGTFAANGAMHVHLGSSIATAGSSTVPDGAYLIAFTLSNPSTGVADSAPLYVVYNNGLTEQQHDAAIAAVSATYVPEPAALSALGLGTIFLGRRRR